jgi:uroporphyrinogen decarboxylase
MGKRLAFDGCLGTQTTLPFGTPQNVRDTVLQLARELEAQRGGLMLSPTHIMEPDVPPENIRAFFEACDEFDRNG